jgi:hypothetical protein
MLSLLTDEQISYVVAEQVKAKRPDIAIVSMRIWQGGAFEGVDDEPMLLAAHQSGLTLISYDQKTIPPILLNWGAIGQNHAGVIFVDNFTIAQGDKSVWGMTLTPSYWIMPNTIQLVGRYHFADSDEKDALLTGYGPGSDPFFESGPIYSGDEFHSFYLGANVHLYENRIVIYNGLEYTLFKDELDSGAETKSLLWQSGARLSF